MAEKSKNSKALIAIIEDEQIVLLGYQMLFESWGYDVAGAGSGAEVVLELQEKGRRPDAILADYRLREGCTGVMAIRNVQEVCGGAIPAILITGDTTPGRLSEAAASGYPVLHKPVDGKQLRALLEEVLSEKMRRLG